MHGKTDQASQRGRVDDRAAALAQHHPRLVFQTQPDADHVDTQHALEVGQAGLVQGGRWRADPGIVVGEVEAAKNVHAGADQALDLRLVADVGADEASFAFSFFDHADGLLAARRVQVGNDDPRA